MHTAALFLVLQTEDPLTQKQVYCSQEFLSSLGMRHCSDVTTGTRAIPFGIMDFVQEEDAKATLSPPEPLIYIC